MSPVQNIPDDFSPYYVEFDEDLGVYNFGSCGKGQLDFKTMKFDWADGLGPMHAQLRDSDISCRLCCDETCRLRDSSD